MTRSFVGTNAANNGSTFNTTLAIPFPAGAAAGDLCYIGAHWTSAATITTDPASSGWTQVDSAFVGTTLSTFIWKKILTAGDITAGSVTLVVSAGSRLSGGSIAYRGAVESPDGSTWGETQTFPAAANQAVPASATVNGDSMVFAMIGGYVTTDPGTSGAMTGWTKRQESITTNAGNPKSSFHIWTKDVDVTTGNASAGTSFAVASGRSSAWTFAVKDAASPGTPGWTVGSIAWGK